MAIEAIGAVAVSAGVEAAKKAAAEVARQLAEKVIAGTVESGSPQQFLQPTDGIDSRHQLETFRVGDVQPPDTNEKAALKAKESDAADELKIKVEGAQPEGASRYEGGSYGKLAENRVAGTEIHHMPPASVNGLDYNDGPAIRMEKEDHHRTASYGSSNEARAYRAEQESLIKDGKWQEAMARDVADIRDKVGGKYDDAIAQMRDYSQTMGCEFRRS
jgi:hypothetical protein